MTCVELVTQINKIQDYNVKAKSMWLLFFSISVFFQNK